MKTIIAGSRTINDYELIKRILNYSKINISEIVCGCANGVDKLGELYGIENNIPIKYFPADWSKGKSAGYTRNIEMAKYSNAAIIIWDGTSKGSQHMIKEAKKHNLVTQVYDINKLNLIDFYA